MNTFRGRAVPAHGVPPSVFRTGDYIRKTIFAAYNCYPCIFGKPENNRNYNNFINAFAILSLRVYVVRERRNY